MCILNLNTLPKMVYKHQSVSMAGIKGKERMKKAHNLLFFSSCLSSGASSKLTKNNRKSIQEMFLK